MPHKTEKGARKLIGTCSATQGIQGMALAPAFVEGEKTSQVVTELKEATSMKMSTSTAPAKEDQRSTSLLQTDVLAFVVPKTLQDGGPPLTRVPA